MINRIAILSFAVLGLFFRSEASFADDDVVRLGPSTPWLIERVEHRCTAARRFGQGETEVLLMIEKYDPSDSIFMVLAGQTVRHRSNDHEAIVRFGSYENEIEVNFFSGSLGENPAMIVGSIIPFSPATDEQIEERREWLEAYNRGEADLEDLDRLSRIQPISEDRYENADHIYVETRRMGHLFLETGPLDELFSGLDSCLDELFSPFGTDLEEQSDLARAPRPRNNPGRWITNADYPRSELRRGGQAIVRFRLVIGREGNVTDCVIVRSTEGEAFKRAVCAALTRNAEFEPALDRDGNPTTGIYSSSVRFEFPRR